MDNDELMTRAYWKHKMRSGFLNAMKDGVRKQGKEWILDM